MLIIFDLDDTLIDTSGSIAPLKLKEALIAMIKEGLEIENFNEALSFLLSLDKGSRNGLETIKHFVSIYKGSKFLVNIGVAATNTALPKDIEIAATSEAVSSLLELSKKSQLCLVSKGIFENQMFKLKKAGIDSKLFSKIIITEDGNKKPHYLDVSNTLKVEPCQVFVCGDKIESDLIPAKELGFTTVHMKWGRGKIFNKNDFKFVDYSITNIGAIKEIITQVGLIEKCEKSI